MNPELNNGITMHSKKTTGQAKNIACIAKQNYHIESIAKENSLETVSSLIPNHTCHGSEKDQLKELM